MHSTQYPLQVPVDLMKEIASAASATGLSKADVMRQSMKLGIPKLREQLAVERGLKPFSKAEASAAFAPDEQWDRLEGVMARRPVTQPERD